jgi:DNA-binding response OmpR family regulator
MSDYIIKPFDLRELDARINAQLRTRGIFHDQASIATKNFKIIPKTHRFLVRGKLTKLTLVEYRIMLRLMQNNHGIVTTQDIIEFAWGEEASTTTPPIRIHISNLRNKIGDNQLTTIQTIPGIGYMLQD